MDSVLLTSTPLNTTPPPPPPATPQPPTPPQPCHPRPPRPFAFPLFVASGVEIHVLLTLSALSPPTRACLCVSSLDFVTVSLPRLSFVFSSWGSECLLLFLSYS